MIKKDAYFVHDAKTYRVRSGQKVKKIEQLSGLSRSTIGRVEGDAGVSEVNAWAYLNALRTVSPNYPHNAPSSRPKSAKVNVVRMDQTKLEKGD